MPPDDDDPQVDPAIAATLDKLFQTFFAGRQVKRLELRPTIVTRLGLTLLGAAVVAFAVASGTWVVACGVLVVYAFASVAISRSRIVVDADGVQAHGVWRTRALAWDEIDHYTYWSAYSGHILVVVGKHGPGIRIDSSYRGGELAAAAVVDELNRRHAARTTFAPFAIEPDGLRHERKGLLPWGNVDKIVVDGQSPPRFHVQARDKSFYWATAKLPRVYDSLLLLERLAQRGVEIDLSSDRLVHDRLQKILAHAAARARAPELPKAELVQRKR